MGGDRNKFCLDRAVNFSLVTSRKILMFQKSLYFPLEVEPSLFGVLVLLRRLSIISFTDTSSVALPSLDLCDEMILLLSEM